MTEPGTSDDIISLHDVSFTWPSGDFSLAVPSFSIREGETVFLLGRSGAGKSTLLSLICGIVTAQHGQVSVAGKELGELRGSARDRLRADTIGIIFQMFNLLPYATALDNILVPLRFSATRHTRCADPRRDALALTGALGLPERLVTKGAASTLSVGQQQRVAVARALIGRPPIVIADEPTSALDADAQAEFMRLVFDQVHSIGATLVMVSHDTRLTKGFDRVVRLEDIATTNRGNG